MKTNTKKPLVGVLLTILSTASLAATNAAETTEPVLRRDIKDFTLEEMDKLALGIDRMLHLAPTDPLSWFYQANMHDVPDCTLNGEALPGCVVNPDDVSTWPEQGKIWQSCPHYNLLFLSWHRIYVYYMERVLRHMSGNPNFTMPYWDYSVADNAEARVVPQLYRVFAKDMNPLYVAERNKWTGIYPRGARKNFVYSPINRGLPMDGAAVSYKRAFEQQEWAQFSNQLSSQPHDLVHEEVGGWYEGNPNLSDAEQKIGWMGLLQTAARDPVFWLHHTNIDRLWDKWNRAGHKNPSTPEEIQAVLDDKNTKQFILDRCSRFGVSDWKVCQDYKAFIFFDVDAHGKPVQVGLSARQLVKRATSVRGLGYTYKVPKAQTVSASAEIAAPRNGGKMALSGGAIESAVITYPQQAVEGAVMNALAADTQQPHRIVLHLDGVRRAPGSALPSGNYAVYINLPSQALRDGEASNLAEEYSAYYADAIGTFAFTGSHSHPMGVDIDITKKVIELKTRGEWQSDALTVTLVPEGAKKEQQLLVERAEVVIQ
ncbi:MAG: tyrosinase family protein [Gammaproteobacteria bacterium]